MLSEERPRRGAGAARATSPGRSGARAALADAAHAGPAAGRPHRGSARAIAAIGEAPPELAPLMLWRRALALAEQPGARAHRRRDGGGVGDTRRARSRASDHGAFRSRESLVEQRIPTAPSRNWVAGHRLLGRFQPFSRDAHRALSMRTIAAVRPGAAAGRTARAEPRSGAGLHRRHAALGHDARRADYRRASAGASAPASAARWGRPSRARRRDAAKRVARIAALDAPTLDAHAEALSRRTARARAASKARIVDKMPGNFNYLGLVALMLPGARIIHCVRDPRDIGLSIFTFRFHGAHPYAHDLADLGWYIAEHDRLMAHWKRGAAQPDPDPGARATGSRISTATLARVLDFLELPLRPGLRALLRKRQPRAHGKPRPGPPAGQRDAASAAGAATPTS